VGREPDDAASSQADIVARIRAISEDAPEPRPLTPEETAKLEALNAKVGKLAGAVRGDHFRRPIQPSPGLKSLIAIPEPPKLEPLGPIEVVVDKASAGRRVRRRKRASAPYPRRAFNDAARLLASGVDKREIARVTRISRKRIDKIELWLRPPKGGAVYELESAPLDENAVVLRLLK
jgi:hypothetical protein